MPAIKPTKRKALIRNLKKLGFNGPYAGGNHQYMMKGKRKLWRRFKTKKSGLTNSPNHAHSRLLLIKFN